MLNTQTRPKILFLSSRLPYPPVGGDKLKNYHLLQILAKHCDVHLVTITDETLEGPAQKFLEQNTASFRVFAKSKRQFRLNALKALFNGRPLQTNYYYFPDVADYIRTSGAAADIVLCTLIRTAQYARDVDKPKILDMADSIALNYISSLRHERSLLWKLLYRFESQRLLKAEKDAVNTFDKTLFFNRQEMQQFESPGRTVWIPHGVDEKLLMFENRDPAYSRWVAFFGKMDYPPNINAAVWFCENVLGRLHPKIRFVIIGAKPARRVRDLAMRYENVQVTGFVEDPYTILKSCLCVAAPMQTGGGIQNKILEAMALGAVVVTTSRAAIPILGSSPPDCLIVRDSAAAMADVVNDIARDPRPYADTARRARQYIRENFTWSIYEKSIMAVLNDCLSPSDNISRKHLPTHGSATFEPSQKLQAPNASCR